ncbi:MAG: ribonuclease HII [Propionibacteriaceae bacterium]|jgi:ribonuclease HII|nr:ribonuclease HII [Propionibacteriaceae bacterium]
MGPYEHLLLAAGLGPVAGADEAGRGACAGPLVAAAVILSDDLTCEIPGLNDSKALTARTRERLCPLIIEQAVAVGIEVVPAVDCDRMGIQAANLHALRQAVLNLGMTPGFVITDGFSVDGVPAPHLGMWKADQVVACVSAASIVAKVTRDHIMDDLDTEYPAYEFAKHKGYGTALHQRHLDELGPCPQHRMSYGNVARAARVRGL